MKKWVLVVMLVAVMGLPMLACGFPIPVTIESEGEVIGMTKPVCAADEAAESCQMRQDAYELMAALQSGSVQDMVMSMNFNAEGDVGDFHVSGYYDFVANADSELGVDLSATIVDGTFADAESTDTITNGQLIIVDDQGYSREGDEEWSHEDLLSDPDAALGLTVILGLGGSVDMFSDPAIFTVELGEDVEMNGQTMHVQTLMVDLQSLMMSGDALGGLLSSGAGASGGALSEEELGMSSEDLAMMAPMFMGFMQGTSFTTTIYIGADDGFIHRVEDNYVFTMDASAMVEDTEPITMSYNLVGNITNHNGAVEISAPEGAVEGGGLFDDLGGGMGSGLFGG